MVLVAFLVLFRWLKMVGNCCALPLQDLGHLFDEINVSTAMHRAAKLSRKYEVRRCVASIQ
jgi:hypothetical protein